MILLSFLGFLSIFLVIGLSSYVKSRSSKEDYYLASKSVSPAFAGLSAVATNNSGYMFIGVIGYTYTVGLASIWLMVGWILGDFIASLYIHKKLRISTETTGEVTFSAVLSKWGGTDFKVVRYVSAAIIVLFLGVYAAAQLNAGGKALHAIFGWQTESGAFLVAVVVALYCMAGGIRASIWTDVAQSFVMVIAMGVLVTVAFMKIGGIGEAWHQMGQIEGYLDLFPRDLAFPGAFGIGLFIVGWLFAGLSVIGQPHIMVRFMVLEKPDQIVQARIWYYSFFVIFYIMATSVGLLSKLYLSLDGLDPELALPTLAQQLLPAPLVGLILAGIFAATMSTADSLILSCSSAFTNDLLPWKISSPRGLRAATVITTSLALGIAIFGSQNVFSIVILAWSVLASAFAPLLIVYSFGGKPSEARAVMMMIIGILSALLWRHYGLQNSAYEGMIGILAGLAVYFVRMPASKAEISTSKDNQY